MMLDPAQDEAFMRLALEQAALAPASGEVPIAALLGEVSTRLGF